MKNSSIDSLVLALGCSQKLMPDLQYVVTDRELIQRLEKLSDIEESDRFGRTLLMYAAIYEREEIVKYLLYRCANVNCQDKDKLTALHFAVQNGNIEIVRLLLSNGADVNAVDVYGNSPIMRCKLTTPFDVFKVLIDNFADPYQKNNYGLCAIDIFGAQNDILMILKTRSIQDE